MSGIYIHIPFCRKVCPYCDFYRRVGEVWDEYIFSLLREMEEYRGEKVDTLYFGGGTPSLMKPKQLEAIFDKIFKTFKLEAKEITLEANPEDVRGENLKIWKDLGINRISIGVQTFKEEGLRVLGRWQTFRECVDAVDRALNFGFNTNVDLIFAYPNQGLRGFEEDLKIALKLSPHHISAYSLQIEEGTLYGYWYKKGKIQIPENLREFYVLRDEILEGNGYIRYEISNFAREGFECLHNLKYWRREKYIGLGPSSASFLPEKRLRYRNLPSLNLYLKNSPPPREYDPLDEWKERMEKIYLRLRIGEMEFEEISEYVELFEEFRGKRRVKAEYLHVFDEIALLLI
jgi:oxygen-independent coproporphyrinogen-3 oxidase